MIEEAAAMAVELIVCQSGLALVDLTADAMAPQARAGGLVGLLADTRPDDRLLVYSETCAATAFPPMSPARAPRAEVAGPRSQRHSRPRQIKHGPQTHSPPR